MTIGAKRSKMPAKSNRMLSKYKIRKILSKSSENVAKIIKEAN